MHPVKYHLTQKLTWMSRQLRSKNDVAALTDWIRTMQSVYTLLVALSDNTILPIPQEYFTGRKNLSISAHTGVNYPSTGTNEISPKHESSDVNKGRPVIKGKRTLPLRKDRTYARKIGNASNTSVTVSCNENNRMELGKDVDGQTPREITSYLRRTERIDPPRLSIEEHTYTLPCGEESNEGQQFVMEETPTISGKMTNYISSDDDWREQCRKVLSEMLHNYDMNYRDYIGKYKFRFEMLLNSIGDKLNIENPRYNKALRKFISKETKQYFFANKPGS